MSDDQQHEAAPSESKPRRPQRFLTSTQVIFAVILSIALMLAVQFSARIADERNLSMIRDTVEEEIDLLRREQARLIRDLDYVRGDTYVEEWAHSEGRMVREGEVLVILLPTGDIVEDTTTPVTVSSDATLETTLPDPEPWQLWWALFFDMPPPNLGQLP